MTLRKTSRTLLAALTFAAITFSLAVSAQAQTTKVIHSFTGQTDGKYPFASLILDQSGNLYGTTYGGGNTHFCGGYGCGTAFRLTPTSAGGWQENVLRSFTGVADGLYVYGGLVQDGSGNLYGTNFEAAGPACCGTVFQLSPTASGAWKETVIHHFTGGNDGGTPMMGRLIIDAAGNLFGTTSLGGADSQGCSGSGCGVVFELSPTSSGSWTETTLHSFTGGDDGGQPQTQLVFDKAGNLFGTTGSGGAHGLGVVFEISATSGGWQETVPHSFSDAPDGATPGPGQALVFDNAGNLFGTTAQGGANADGIVFELSPTAGGSWTENVLYNFASGHDGASPLGGVIFDASGNLYGTTYHGGILGIPNVPKNNPGCGVAYKLAPASGGTWTESVIHHFTCGADGGYPVSGLIMDGSGTLYGTANIGGKYSYGVVFEITP